MRFRIPVGIALLFLAVDYAGAYDLDRHRWQDRLLFLVAPNAEDAELADQLRWIERRREAVLDRDLRVFQLFVDQGRVDDQILTPASVRLLRARLGLTEQDRLVILIGKDGGVKRRAGLNTDLSEIFLQIDGMPMRQQEMRAKQKAGIEVTPP
jgi:bifunctional DNA-binding transcriptional regulator/antitoxin component of YhaV-PrlF toxin-antitoxin module